jgi:UDP-N-acetylmuramate dehydrogenase
MPEMKENVPLAPLTTFEIGGAARYLVKVRTEEQIRDALSFAKEKNLRYVVLGGGSNVLVPDEGIDGLVIRIVGNLFSHSEGAVDAWAGTNLLELIRSVGAQGYGGWEKLAGIPGSIGGAVRGNAGAFGPEIKDFVTTVRALNAETGETREFSNAKCDFSYRHSFFKDHSEWIIARVQLQLERISSDISLHLAEETIAEREKRHLQNVRAAGSYFMNPVAPREIQELFEKEKNVKSREGRVPAGWLIEKAGMKGATVGGAIASLQHPNYLVNQGTASAANVRALADKVRVAVRSQLNIQLQEEAAVL